MFFNEDIKSYIQIKRANTRQFHKFIIQRPEVVLAVDLKVTADNRFITSK